MARLVTLATCSLNQWALDFTGNTARIIDSIKRAKEAGATLRVGPELEICGYGCLDHFLEEDTFQHSWEALCQIIDDAACQDIVLDIGMPVRHKNVGYNCRVICYNRKIILIRPKKCLANDGNYHEMRYFTGWTQQGHVEKYRLESIVEQITKQETVPFGDGIISTKDTCFGCEICEELFTPTPPHGPMGLDGVEIFTNSSGSHFELGKSKTRRDLIIETTKKAGGIYLYANQRGCDGDRLYYDGSSMIVCNGKILACDTPFSLEDVEIVTATVDLEEVRSYRTAPSRGMQAQTAPKFPRIDLKIRLSKKTKEHDYQTTGASEPIDPPDHDSKEEIALGGACWLWDYVRRSHTAGFFIPLLGDIDSCATSVVVLSMCRLVFEAMQNKNRNQQVIDDARRIAGKMDDPQWIPATPQELTELIISTCYMGSKNSSPETRNRATALARAIGSYHVDIDTDAVTTAIAKVFDDCDDSINGMPRSKSSGGSIPGKSTLENVQARSRMVLAYYWAQLLPTFRGRKGGGSLLVLGSANVDDALMGYLTKYDSADIDPIGGVSKTDLEEFIKWSSTEYDLPILKSFEPLTATTSDEDDIKITYAELSTFGRLRKLDKLGPWGSYCKLLSLWGKPESEGGKGWTARQIAEKTRKFFSKYAINRHKMTVLTPSLHLEGYSNEDNRFDLRPFLYPAWDWQNAQIDGDVKRREGGGK